MTKNFFNINFFCVLLCKYILTTFSSPKYNDSQIKACPIETSAKFGIFSLKNLEKEPESVAKVVEKTTKKSKNSSDTKEVTDTSEGNTQSNPETKAELPENSPETSDTVTEAVKDTDAPKD